MSPRPAPAPTMAYTHIVVGGGSAGCIVAARLAEKTSVLLLEAGPEGAAYPQTLSADGFKDAFSNDDLMWHRMTAPQRDCANRKLYAGTGHAMGGSGAVNGMVYTRGDRRDYDAWPLGWQWNDVRPIFSAIEQRLRPRPRPATGFAQTFINAALHAGYRRKDGMNDGDLTGVIGCNDMNYEGETRRNSYRAFIMEADLPNLTIHTGAKVQHLHFDKDKRAIALDYIYQGQMQRVAFSGELVLCAGALETPRLLLLSGIGPAEDLRNLGIPLVQDMPEIGKNLQDHPNVCMFYKADHKIDFAYPQLYAFDHARSPLHDKNRNALAPDICLVCYAAPASLKQSMLRMLPILALPGMLHQIKFLRLGLRQLVKAAFLLPQLRKFVDGVFGIVVILGKPTSRGQIRLRSADPAIPPHIDPAYYSTEQDRQVILAAIEKARSIARQPELLARQARPLSDGGKQVSDKKLWSWLTAATMTTFHFCGTCRMGDDPQSPVDPQLRLKGIANLRIADASVIPEIPVAALNAPSMMIGYRAADFILAQEAS